MIFFHCAMTNSDPLELMAGTTTKRYVMNESHLENESTPPNTIISSQQFARIKLFLYLYSHLSNPFGILHGNYTS
jgi:hypothetical protein